MKDKAKKMMMRDIQLGLHFLRLPVSSELVQQLADHVELLLKWNQVCNLTAITEPREIVRKHILDSLSVAQYVRGIKVVDIGSGGGYPGIPLSLVHPYRRYQLVDSSAKKIQFLRHVVAALKLSNVEVLHRRSQELSEQTKFDTIIVRAVASLELITKMVDHILSPSGCVLAMKGQYPKDELEQLDDRFLFTVKKISFDKYQMERHLVLLTRKVDCLSGDGSI